MGNKELVTSEKITQLLIGNWLLWSLVFGILYNFIFKLITSKMQSMILVAIVAIVLQVIIALILWKLSTSSSFKKRTISYDDVPKVMKNLIIFTILICVFTGIYNASRVNSTIDEAVKSDYMLKYKENMMSTFYTDAQMEEYQAQKKEMIQETKKELYIYLIVLEIGLTLGYLAVLPLEKKEILKYVR